MTESSGLLKLDRQVLDVLMPLHIVFDAQGRVEGVGSLLHTLVGPQAGAHLADVISVRRPETACDGPSLLARAGRRLFVELHLPPGDAVDGSLPSVQRLLGVVVPLADGRGLMQLAFGTELAQAVQTHNLTVADFSPVDNVMDVLYLLEAQGLVRRELEALTDRLERARQTAERDAETDRLTGVGNRRAMDRVLRDLFRNASGSGFGVMHLDLDKFKQINDTLGHAAGDSALIQVARVLRSEIRACDHVCRIGGDEFLVLLPDCGEATELALIAQRILHRLRDPVDLSGQDVNVSLSIGIAMSVDYAELDMDQILSDADAALYRSKNSGRNCYHFHRDPDHVDRRRSV